VATDVPDISAEALKGAATGAGNDAEDGDQKKKQETLW
jgi:hypothetical protein